jgi:CheY-like chemotaxis protein
MKTILLVEDNEDVRELVGMVLRDGGYEVCEAENGQDALDRLETMSATPCLLLLDLMMPVMGGEELLRILRERNILSALPVVVLSAGGQPSQVPDAKKFIRKPADPNLILDSVREVCGSPE